MQATTILSRLAGLLVIVPVALGAQAPAFGPNAILASAMKDSTGASVSVAARASVATDKDSLGPSSFRYKGVTISPIAFLAMEALWRQRNETADIGSSFNGIPFNNSTNGQLSEFRATARQSRLGLAVQGTTGGGVKIGGFWESDFLSSGITSN